MTTKPIEPKEMKNPDLDPNHKLLEESTVEEKGKSKAFLSKRNVIIVIVAFLVSIVLLVLTFLFVLNVNWSNLFKSMGEGFAHNMGYLWFFLLIVMMVYVCVSMSLPTIIRLKQLGVKIRLIDKIVFTLTLAFFKATTPISLISDPYALYWMRQRGVAVSRVTSIWFSNSFFWNVAHLFVSIPTVSIVFSQANMLLSGSSWEHATFVILIIGFIFDILGIGFSILISTSRWFHYFLSKIFNWFKKKFHKPYHTKEQIADKYRAKAVIKNDFINYLKDWKVSLLITVFFALCEIITYASIGWAMLFVQYVDGVKIEFDFIKAFNCCSAATCANKLGFFIPGGEGTIELLLKTFLNAMGVWKESYTPIQEKSVIDNGIMVWRSFNAYFPALVGIGGIITVVVQEIRKRKNKSK